MYDLELLIIDALRPKKTHGTHFTLEQAIEKIKYFRPKKALLTNATHDIHHSKVNKKLEKLSNINLDVSYAHDGLIEKVFID